MCKGILKCLLILLFPLALNASVRSVSLNEIKRNHEDGKSDLALAQILAKISELEVFPKSEKLLLFNCYNLAGEIYFNNSDIGEAYQYWQKSYALCKNIINTQGECLAEYYSNLSRYYTFRMKVDSAFFYSQLALNIYSVNRARNGFNAPHKIYRAHAIALKAYKNTSDPFAARIEAKVYLDSASYFQQKYAPEDRLFEALVLRDLGNLQTDLILYNKTPPGKIMEAKRNLLSANQYYDQAIKVLSARFGNKHSAIAETYFVKGVSYSYYNQFDSLESVIGYYQKALCSLAPGYNNLSMYSCPTKSNRLLNPTLAVIFFRFKLDAMFLLYQQRNDKGVLESIYQQAKASVKIWEELFKDLKSREVQHALETYGASPFGGIILYADVYYQLTKKEEVKRDVFRWINLNKYSSILKNNFEGSNSITPESIDIIDVQEKLTEDQALVDFYVSSGKLVAFCITTKSCTLFDSKNISSALKKCDSLLTYLNKHEAENYCRVAKFLYDTLVSPITSILPYNIKHIIICPNDRLAQIPFDALVLNQTKKYKSADFLIRHYRISYGLSSGLLFGGHGNSLIDKKMTLISPIYRKQSDLPFTGNAMKKLRSSFDIIAGTNLETSDATILHVSAHTHYVPGNSRQTYILDSDTSKIYLDNLPRKQTPYKLAVLTACETGNGDMELGEGVINFSRGLYLSGTKSSVTTLWKVDDEATSEIINQFYSSLLNSTSADLSLHESKLSYLSSAKSIDDYDPYYWAGLVYTGKDLSIEKYFGSTLFEKMIIFGLTLLAFLWLIRQFRS